MLLQSIGMDPISYRLVNNLRQASRQMGVRIDRISTGLRITRAADDAVGLAVATNLSSDATSARAAIRNTNQGITVVDLASGATTEVEDIISRMKELAIESKTGTLTGAQRNALHTEFVTLRSDIDRIANATEFNSIKLTSGGTASLNIQVGIHNTASDRIKLDFGNLLASAGLGITTALSLSTTALASQAIVRFSAALNTTLNYQARYGGGERRLDSALNNLEMFTVNMDSAVANIMDADLAAETAQLAKLQIVQMATAAMLVQVNTSNYASKLLEAI